MEKQNITLALPKDLLKRLKHIAIDQNTSLSGLLTKTLESLVIKEEVYKTAKARQMVIMEAGFPMGLAGRAEWQRDELYER